MKLLHFIYIPILAALSLAPAAHAQTSGTTGNTQDTPKVVYKNNTVFWKDNVLVHHQNGQFNPLSSTITYPNGTSVSTDGTVRLASGRTQKLKPHQALNPQGKIVLAADDIFTLSTIKQTEQQVVGDTEVKLFTINGELTTAASGDQASEIQESIQKQIALLEQLNELLEKRTALIDATLTVDQKEKISAQRNLVEAKIAAIDRRLRSKSSTTSSQ